MFAVLEENMTKNINNVYTLAKGLMILDRS